MTVKKNIERYLAAAHAVQSGVAMEIMGGSEAASPKHLLTGIRCAMRYSGSLVDVLVAKGVVTESEAPDRLRAGLNMAMRDHASIVQLLFDKRIITKEEFYERLAAGMEEEAADSARRASEKYGRKISLA